MKACEDKKAGVLVGELKMFPRKINNE